MFYVKIYIWSVICIVSLAQARITGIPDRGIVRLPSNPGIPQPEYIVGASPKTAHVDDGEGYTLGVHFLPRATPMIPQAVAGILIQALTKAYNVFGSIPLATSNDFRHTESLAGAGSLKFNAGINITAFSNVTADKRLTNSRLVTVISLLGFDFSEQDNMTSLWEYDFDVVLEAWRQPETKIASGSLRNNPEALPVATS